MDLSTETLPQSGPLEQTELGFTYVNLPDDYIHKLVEFIRSEGYEPPAYFGEGLIGAHITVIYPWEAASGPITEIGTEIHFELKECGLITNHYCIFVEAPILAELRQKYGLPPAKYPFHITIGMKNFN